MGTDCFMDLTLGQYVPFFRGADGHLCGFGFSGYGYTRPSGPTPAAVRTTTSLLNS